MTKTSSSDQLEKKTKTDADYNQFHLIKAILVQAIWLKEDTSPVVMIHNYNIEAIKSV